jgi:hypothetical protein
MPPAGSEALKAVVRNFISFWDAAYPYVNRRFGGKYHIHFQASKSTGQKFKLAGGN